MIFDCHFFIYSIIETRKIVFNKRVDNLKRSVLQVTEKELLENGYRKYSGEDVDVYFNTDICTHSANCVRGNPAVFDTKRRPWVLPDNASADEVARVIDTCPSGALKYMYSGESKVLPTKTSD